MLLDGERQLTETSIIIEYLQLAHPGPVRLLPAEPMAALDVRFLDRFFDLHVMDAMQIAVEGALAEARTGIGDCTGKAERRSARSRPDGQIASICRNHVKPHLEKYSALPYF